LDHCSSFPNAFHIAHCNMCKANFYNFLYIYCFKLIKEAKERCFQKGENVVCGHLCCDALQFVGNFRNFGRKHRYPFRIGQFYPAYEIGIFLRHVINHLRNYKVVAGWTAARDIVIFRRKLNLDPNTFPYKMSVLHKLSELRKQRRFEARQLCSPFEKWTRSFLKKWIEIEVSWLYRITSRCYLLELSCLYVPSGSCWTVPHHTLLMGFWIFCTLFSIIV
jgi:hypothetical protein